MRITMKLEKLIDDVTCEEVIGNTKTEITGICSDSRKINKGDLFICYVGNRVDSHDFADQAVQNGAAAIVCERKLNIPVPQIVVKSGRSVVAPLARAFYGYPDRKLKIVAITGTNGKTTTTYMLKSIFDENKTKTAVIGTLGVLYGDKFISPELTTPDPIFLHGLFADMADCGVQYVFMEVSAHALWFGKVDGIKFDVGIFTNCTQDHLDFFKDMKTYSDCKRKLFEGDRCASVVVNSDDKLGAELANSIVGAFSYGLENPADTFAVDLDQRIDGTSFVINLFDELYEINLKMPALHNVYNALAAATCAKISGVKTEIIARGLSALKGVTGRLEEVASFNGGRIFVDFAHTPDGLEKSLSSLKRLCEGRLYCLFGCGGNRDATKRPVMGSIAAKYSDFVILTSDNPRYEDPYDIISQIEPAIAAAGRTYVAMTDRRSATEYAVKLLNEGDVLLVAGKGGETYQEIMGIKHDYDDTKVIKEIIARY
ncbi:MAG: UDP-N-acetylmuramoyl-L-alanyl-D-glutamate--2,6-diaminopimelate ligase [Candidatus Coproplasma sp.]